MKNRVSAGVGFKFFTIIAFLCFASGVDSFARDFTALQAEVWVDLEPMGPNGPNPDLPRADAIHALLEEARVIFSGMIYGFNFEYRPADLSRHSEEKFKLTPISMIPWGAPGFEYRETRNDASSIYIRVRYLTTAAEISRLEAWVSADLQDAAGTGFASYYEGTSARLKSITDSCKEAVRNCVRGMTHNKPSQIQGRLVLSDIPRIGVFSGKFRTETRVRLDIQGIEAYRTF